MVAPSSPIILESLPSIESRRSGDEVHEGRHACMHAERRVRPRAVTRTQLSRAHLRTLMRNHTCVTHALALAHAALFALKRHEHPNPRVFCATLAQDKLVSVPCVVPRRGCMCCCTHS